MTAEAPRRLRPHGPGGRISGSSASCSSTPQEGGRVALPWCRQAHVQAVLVDDREQGNTGEMRRNVNCSFATCVSPSGRLSRKGLKTRDFRNTRVGKPPGSSRRNIRYFKSFLAGQREGDPLVLQGAQKAESLHGALLGVKFCF